MANNPPRAYLDACVLISYIEDDKTRLRQIDELLRRGGAGELELITSVLSQAEVAFTNDEREHAQLDADVEDRINGLWLPGSPVHLVEFTPAIGLGARDLLRQAVVRKWTKTRAYDAVHLATAQRLGCVDFFTYSKDMPRFAPLVGMSIGPPDNPQGVLAV